MKIAFRYFRGKRSLQAIQIISWISIGAIAVSTAAMIILFSIFNGLEDTIKQLFGSFYPDLKVESATGQFFQLSEDQKRQLDRLEGVRHISFTLEDMVLLANEEEQRPAILRGIEESWFQIADLDRYMIEGSASWDASPAYPAVILGLNVAASLRVSARDAFSSVQVYYPKNTANVVLNPESALKKTMMKPEGVFHIQEEFDNRYALCKLELAQSFFDRPGEYSSIDFQLLPGVSTAAVQKEIQKIVGSGMTISDRFQQNKTLYMIMKSEKWAVYAILSFVLILASFNMVGSLSMLVLEKKKDTLILKSMGAVPKFIQKIFLLEGVFLALIGCFIGLAVGSLFCLGQYFFGWIQLPDGFLMTAYPVSFQVTDYLLIFATSMAVGLGAAVLPSKKASKQALVFREE